MIRMPIHYILFASAGAAFSALKYIAETALAGVFESIAAPSLVSGCTEHGLEGLSSSFLDNYDTLKFQDN